MKIIFPTDGSKAAASALEFAITTAGAHGAGIVVVAVAQEMDWPHEAAGGMEQMLLSFCREYAHQAAEQIRKRGLEAEERIEAGKPAEVIVKAAREEKALAIVMGTHGRSGLARALIGSVADRVIRHASCPVILVPSREDLR